MKITDVEKSVPSTVLKGIVCGMPCKAMDGGPTSYLFLSLKKITNIAVIMQKVTPKSNKK